MSAAGNHIGRAAALAALTSMLVLPRTGLSDGARVDPPTVCSGAPRVALAETARSADWPSGGRALRVVTYNIHSGLGSGFSIWKPRAQVERNLRQIASDIAAAGPAGEAVEVVALNEVDFGSRRSAWIDEAAFLAGELAAKTGHHYEIVRGQTWERSMPGREVRFGNALLVRLPLVSASSCLFASGACEGARAMAGLPSLRARRLRGLLGEARGVIKATVLVGAKPVDVFVTHLDAFSADAREAQAMHLLHRFLDPGRTTVVLGDLNAVTTQLTGGRRFFRGERTLDILTSSTLSDARTTHAAMNAGAATEGWATYPAAAPLWPLDAVLASVDLVPSELSVIGGTASDHRGLYARLALVDDAASLALHKARHDRTRSAQLERIRACDVPTAEARLRRGWLIDRTGFASLEAPAS